MVLPILYFNLLTGLFTILRPSGIEKKRRDGVVFESTPEAVKAFAMGKKNRMLKVPNSSSSSSSSSAKKGADGEEARLSELDAADAAAASTLADDSDLGISLPEFEQRWNTRLAETVEGGEVAAGKEIYMDLVDSQYRLSVQLKVARAQHERDLKRSGVLKERIQRVEREGVLVLTELEQTRALKDKLQELCQQLQRQNKAVIENAEASKKAIAEKVGLTIDDVQTKLNEHEKRRLEQGAENEELRGQLKNLLGKFDQREEVFTKQLKHAQLETEVAEARLQQQIALKAQEEARSELLTKQLEEATKTSAASAKQLEIYKDNFEKMQDTVNQSNGAFKEYSKRFEELISDREKIKGQNRALQILVKESEARHAKVKAADKSTQKEVVTLRAQKVKLERLCRTMQGERSERIAEIEHLKAQLCISPSSSCSGNSGGNYGGVIINNSTQDDSDKNKENKNAEEIESPVANANDFPVDQSNDELVNIS